jgi:hypothetical protein
VAKKNANGDGMRSRKRRDGRWEARYWSEGRRRSVYGRSRKEVVENLAGTRRPRRPSRRRR